MPDPYEENERHLSSSWTLEAVGVNRINVCELTRRPFAEEGARCSVSNKPIATDEEWDKLWPTA